MKKNTKTRIKTSILLLLLTYLMIKYDYIAVYVLIIFGVLSTLEFFKITKEIFKKHILSYLINTFFMTYIFIFSSYYVFFLNFFQLKFIFYVLLFGCVASDVGGFIFGKIFKGPRLTKISPNKTYSGALGSIFFTSLLIFLLIYISTNTYSYLILITSVLTSIGCQTGDLFFSYLKRKANLKDYGSILPGHGGILDRIDGILLGVPVGFFSLIFLN